jgi:hypothetical protein
MAIELGLVFSGNLDFTVLNHCVKFYDLHPSPPVFSAASTEYLHTKNFPRSALVTSH